MDAALIAALPLYTLALVLACRHYWSHRCVECSYRHRAPHPTGRHRATRRPPTLPALPPAGDPDATTPNLPTLSVLPRPTPSPHPRSLPAAWGQP